MDFIQAKLNDTTVVIACENHSNHIKHITHSVWLENTFYVD